MSGKPITHSRWLKGLQSGFDRYSQPKGSIARVSNLLYTRRGALKTCDGTQLITQYNSGGGAALQPASANFGPITEVYLYQPIGGTPAYFGIVKDINTHIAAPTGLGAADGGGGGNLSAGTYRWVITALDGAGGETTVSNEPSLTLLVSHKASLTWTPVTNAAGGYNVYRTVAGGGAGTEHFVATVAGQATAAYTDNTADASLGPSTPPGANSTQVCQFYQFTFPSYGAAQIVKTLPADNIIFQPGNPIGGGGGGSHGGGGGGGPQTPQGGTTGNLSPLPMILQFTNKMILGLGNGITPYTSDGTTGGTTQITNSFSAVYPVWTASTAWLQGDQIQVNISATLYVFTAVQGGTSGAGGGPSFSATLGSTVADNNIIWKNSGQVSTSPPPRGAANIEVYAGSLWCANTGIVESSDQLDGPSALRMSDLNNPLSWNPLNAAQISPDDSDQNTGIKAFTVAEAGIAPQNFLMYFKNYSTYLIQGVFGATNFSITRLQTDLGCIASRSIQFIPGFGIMRLSHLGFAVTDGITDKLENPEAIRPYLFPESTESDITLIDQSYVYFAKAAQTANPPMYVCALPLLTPYSTLFNTLAFSVPTPSGAGATFSGANVIYVVVQAVLTTGQTLTSNEYVVGTSAFVMQSFFVHIPATSAVASWKVYWGVASGAENQFITVTGSASLTVFNVSAGAVFTNGSPVSGLGGYLTRLFCYDLVLKSWTVVDLPFPISVLHQFRTPGSNPITLMAGFFDGALRRWQMGDSQWDAGATNAGSSTINVQWTFRDAEVFLEGGTVKLFHNEVTIRGDGGPTAVNVTPTVNGNIEATLGAALTALGGGQYEARVRILQTAENIDLTISGSGPATVESVQYEVNPRPVGSNLVFS